MKKIVVLIMAVCLLFSVSAVAKSSVKINLPHGSVYQGFGVGFFGGDENCLSLKKYINDNENALQAGLGWWYWGNTISFSIDYLFNNFSIVVVDPGDVVCYWGLGVSGGLGEWFNAYVRIPFGISYVFEKNPIDITLQIVPAVGWNNGLSLGGTGGLGARWYF
ncbi:MAG: hypothetical protein LLG37_02695 [Spirochaetia bacterium]|nr:hypothetical protein [Spirochaetia bacterium]